MPHQRQQYKSSGSLILTVDSLTLNRLLVCYLGL